mgnify:CR=1 FL=1
MSGSEDDLWESVLREVAQRLRALDTLPEVPSSILINHVVAHNYSSGSKEELGLVGTRDLIWHEPI